MYEIDFGAHGEVLCYFGQVLNWEVLPGNQHIAVISNFPSKAHEIKDGVDNPNRAPICAVSLYCLDVLTGLHVFWFKNGFRIDMHIYVVLLRKKFYKLL
jgi:hypothetical protein